MLCCLLCCELQLRQLQATGYQTHRAAVSIGQRGRRRQAPGWNQLRRLKSWYGCVSNEFGEPSMLTPLRNKPR